jgi:hypothetical protein
VAPGRDLTGAHGMRSAATASRLRAVRRISFRAAGAREDAYLNHRWVGVARSP